MKNLTLAIPIAMLTAGTQVFAQPNPATQVELLFVQNAEAVVFANGTLTLKGISPSVIFFSDRQLEGDELSYEIVQILDGELPATGGISSLFIDS